MRRVDQQIPSRPIPGRRRPAVHFLVAGGRQSLGPHGPWFLQSSASWVLNRQKSPHAWVTAIATRLATGQRGAVTNFGALGVGLGLRHVTTFGNVSPGSNGTFRGASQVLKAISADRRTVAKKPREASARIVAGWPICPGNSRRAKTSNGGACPDGRRRNVEKTR